MSNAHGGSIDYTGQLNWIAIVLKADVSLHTESLSSKSIFCHYRNSSRSLLVYNPVINPLVSGCFLSFYVLFNVCATSTTSDIESMSMWKKNRIFL